MKRFMLFYGCNCYPFGGMKDFNKEDQFDTLQEAFNKFNKYKEKDLIENEIYPKIEWAHVYDLKNQTIIWDLDKENFYED